MSNRVTLAQLREMTPNEVEWLPLDQIAMLQEDIAELKSNAKFFDEKINSALLVRTEVERKEALKAKGADTGTVTLPFGPYTVRVDVPKRVEWSQEALAEAVARLADLEEDPKEYVKIKYEISETNYKAWTTKVKNIFDPARTVKHGRVTAYVEKTKTGKV